MNKSSTHPLLKDNAVLATRPLEVFINTINEWLENLIPGGVVWGYQRVGKTRAVRYLMNNARLARFRYSRRQKTTHNQFNCRENQRTQRTPLPAFY